MDREFIHTRELEFCCGKSSRTTSSATRNILASERAEEGFEKRAALEFYVAAPGHSRRTDLPLYVRNLEEEYPESIARVIAEGKGWAASVCATRGAMCRCDGRFPNRKNRILFRGGSGGFGSWREAPDRLVGGWLCGRPYKEPRRPA